MKTSHFIYYLPVILKLSRNWKSIGVTHEFWDDLSGDFDPPDLDSNNIYIEDIGDGGCKSDKYERDIRLLKEELKINPKNERNWYYLGQSYFDIGRYAEAIETFDKRKTMGENPYEVYKSYYYILLSKLNLNKSEEEINKSFEECYKSFPFMLEPIYYLMQFYLNKEEYEKAFNIGKLGIDIEIDDTFMTEFQIYDYKYKDDMVYVCIKNKKYGIGVKLSLELLKNDKLDKDDKERIKENLDECLINLVKNDL
jgi:tetratricopeptide (TPR) repeat protein